MNLRPSSRTTPRWDGKVQGIQITGSTNRHMEVRALVSAVNASVLWDFRCEVRERLITFVNDKFPGSFAKIRTDREGPDFCRSRGPHFLNPYDTSRILDSPEPNSCCPKSIWSWKIAAGACTPSQVWTPRLREHYGEDNLRQAMAYTGAKSRFIIFSLIFRFTYTMVFFLSPGAAYWQSLFLPLGHWADLAFVLSLLILLQLISPPPQHPSQSMGGETLRLLQAKKPEISSGTRFSDFSFLLFSAGGLFLGLSYAANNLGSLWWLYGWLGFSVFQLFFIVIYPLVIAPLFNRFTPLEEGPLKAQLHALAKNLSFPIEDIYVMDGSRRSGHSNAYFTGFGKFRRIVLYDTLIQQHSVEEIAAVLAHEIGHYKKRHILWNLVLGFFLSALGFYALSLILAWQQFFQAFGLSPTPGALMVLVFFFQRPLTFLFTPLVSLRSRRAEYEADAFAREAMGGSQAMVKALLKLSTDNLSNPNPSPLYSGFYFSHPALAERLRALEKS
jgi:STE24 endopeptidase